MNLDLFPADMHAPDHPFVIIDTETTGLHPGGGDRLIEVAAIRAAGPVVVATFSSFIHPRRAIPAEATRVNGIRDDMVVAAPPAPRVLPLLTAFSAGDTLVFQNARFDLAFLNHELGHAGLPAMTNPVLDTRLMARLFWPGLESYGLGRLASHAGMPLPGTRHRALADCELTLAVFRVLLGEARRAGINTVWELKDRSELAAGAAAGGPGA